AEPEVWLSSLRDAGALRAYEDRDRSVPMDGDHDFVLFFPGFGAICRQCLGTRRLIEGHFLGADPAFVLREEIAPWQQRADGFGIHARLHRLGQMDDRAVWNERPVSAVVKNRRFLDDGLIF